MVDLRRLGRSVPPRPRTRRPRRALWACAVGAVVLGVVGWLLLPEREAGPSGAVSFATGVRTGVYEKYGKLLRDRLGEDLPDVDLRLVHTQGSVQNLESVATGETGFTIAAADAVATYRDEERPGAERLRACARLYDDYMQLVVPADSKVESAEDLGGLRVGVGEERSGVNLVAGRLLRAAGLAGEEDLTRVHAGIDRMPGLLAEGELDAFFWSGGLPTDAVRRLADRTDIRLVQLGDLVPRLHQQEPETRHYRSAVMPPDAYPEVQQGESVKTVAIANLLVTTDRSDESLTEGLTRAVLRNRDEIGKQVHAAQKVDLRTAIYTDPLPLHEGAQRYYRSVKP